MTNTDQLSFSFSLRSGLMTSGCAAAASASAASGFASSCHGPDHDVRKQQVRVVIDRDVRRQHEVADVNAFADLKWLTSALIDSGIAPAWHVIRKLWTRCSRIPPAARPAGVPLDLERDFGLDHFLGADPGEVEVEHLFAEVVPLHVANQDGLGRSVHVQIGEVPGRLDHPPDVIARERDGNDGLLVPVDDRRDQALLPQPPRNPAARALVLRRVSRLDLCFGGFRHRNLKSCSKEKRGPADRRGNLLC